VCRKKRLVFKSYFKKIDLEREVDAMDQSEQDKRTRVGIGTGLVGLFVNLALVIIKLIAGFMASSVSILADAMNSLGDTAGALLTIGGFYVANKPPDREHPYGHQRAEYISGLFTAIIIVVVGFQFLISSIEKILDPTSVASSRLVLILLIVSVLIKIGLGIYYYYKNKHMDYPSNAIQALVKDSFYDTLMNIVIILSYWLEIQMDWYIDGYIGALVALIILYGGVTSIIESSNDLLGTRPDAELIDRMQTLLDSYNKLVGYHDLILHKYGPNKIFATVDIEIDSRWDLVEAHKIIDTIEKDFAKEFDIKLVGHLDPVELDDEEQNAIYAVIKKTLKSYNHKFHFHDFRLEEQNGQKEIVFDVTVPDSVEASDLELHEMITKDLSEELNHYPIRIHFDRDYFLKE